MRKKAAYLLFSLLIVLSGTFGIAPMAFCTMKTAAPQHSCCKPPVAKQKQCPICSFELNQVQPSPAHISIQPHTAPLHCITLLPHTFTALLSPNIAMTDYAVAYYDTSPPLYIQNGILRI
jgi:hypothetical protein